MPFARQLCHELIWTAGGRLPHLALPEGIARVLARCAGAGALVRRPETVRRRSAEADAYWASRPRASRIAACASHQSAALGSREALLAHWRRLRDRYRGRSIPRPPAWSGFRVVPDTIEFWTHRPHRLHERERFVRTRGGWRRELLKP